MHFRFYFFYDIQHMMNFYDYTNENKTEHNSMWPYIPDHSYRILIIGGSGSGKTNALLNSVSNQPDIFKVLLRSKLTFCIVFWKWKG